MGFGLPGELLGQQVEGVEVRLGLPRRVDRRGEGVHERVHVGGGQVVLFVPGGGREHDVGQQGGGGHPEVGGNQQVQLPFRRLLMPFHVLGLEPLGMVLAQDIVVGSQQVPQEVLVALGRGAEQVGAPQHQGPRPVFRGVHVLDRRVQGAALQGVGDVAGGVRRGAGGDGGLGLVREVQRVRGRTAGRTASSPAARTGRSCPRCACRPGAPRRAGRSARRRSSRRAATGRCACTSTPVPIMVRGGRDQSSALASDSQPVIGRHFSWPT